MVDILLFGALLVAIYVISDALTLRIERWRGTPLGAWRSGLFFVLFLVLLLLSMQFMSWVMVPTGGAPP